MRIPPHAGYAFVEFDTREQAQEAITAINETRIGGRRVAVDFAYDIRLYKAASKNAGKQTSSTKTSEEEMEDDEKSEDDIPIATPLGKKRELVLDENSGTKKQKIPEDSRKLFLVNVPYDSDKASIKTGICEFASISNDDIESVLLVKDGEKFSGKAFIIFRSVEVAEKVLNLERSSLPQMFGDMYKNKDGRLATAPIEGVGCLVNGRRIAIMKSLTREEVEKEKLRKEEENKPKSSKVVNRQHIDLINAGWINEQHESWSSLSAAEQKIRTASNEERKFKLGNANYIINPKRLTIKNVPKHFENGDLMKAIISALGMTGSKKIKRAGIRKVAIVKDKIQVVGKSTVEQPDWNMDMPSDDETKSPSTGAKMAIKKKSRGFAFVDFTNTESALSCLKAMNNIVGGFGSGIAKRPIVEFSFDDVRKLQIQKNRSLAVKKDTPPLRNENPKSIKRLGRGQKQRLKRKLAKEQL
jgi:nucleolar protein 4